MAPKAVSQGRSTLVWSDWWIRLPAGAVSKLLSLMMGTALLEPSQCCMSNGERSCFILCPLAMTLAQKPPDIWCNKLSSQPRVSPRISVFLPTLSILWLHPHLGQSLASLYFVKGEICLQRIKLQVSKRIIKTPLPALIWPVAVLRLCRLITSELGQ